MTLLFQIPNYMANCGFLATLAQLSNVPAWWSTTFSRRHLVLHVIAEQDFYQVKYVLLLINYHCISISTCTCFFQTLFGEALQGLNKTLEDLVIELLQESSEMDQMAMVIWRRYLGIPLVLAQPMAGVSVLGGEAGGRFIYLDLEDMDSRLPSTDWSVVVAWNGHNHIVPTRKYVTK